MRKLIVALIFLLSFPFFLYLTFPIERFVENGLCRQKISCRKVEIRRLPLKVELDDVKIPSLPFELDKVVVTPQVSSLLSKEKKFNVLAQACGGILRTDASYPVRSVKFKLEKLRVENCLKKKSLPLSISGTLFGSGTLSLRKNSLIGGAGNFKLQNLQLKKIVFGLLSLRSASLGDVKVTYKVKRKNVVDVEAQGKGRDGKLSVKGYINLNIRRIEKSYVNLKVKLIPYVEPFKGQTFSFRIKGFLDNLSFR